MKLGIGEILIILVVILKFLNVEKNIVQEQAEIKARHEKAKQE